MLLSARSFSQLSITMNMPESDAPAASRSASQAVGSTKIACSSAALEVTAAKTAKARMCPTRRITRGANRQPRMNPPE